MRRLRIVLFCLFWGLVACETAVLITPTPFPTETAVTPIPLANTQPIPLEIVDLVATPATSQNALVQVTGQYYRRPKLICESDPHSSPATWEIASGEAVALAGGFDSELRRLLPDGLTMTVEGHWLLWHGPVGCGKRATVEDVWYLQVNRIVSPSPITQVTLTPFIPGVEVAAAGTAEIMPTQPLSGTVAIPTLLPPEQAATATPDLVEPTGTVGVESTEVFTVTDTPESEASTPIISPTATLGGQEGGTGTPTATLAPAVSTNTPTPSSTPDPNATATNTPTPSSTPDPNATATNTPIPSSTPDPNMTATFTPTPGAETRLIIQEEIEALSLSKNILGENEIHAWPFFVDVAEVVTVTAVTADDVALVISVVDEGGTVLAEEDVSAGEVAVIEQLDLLPPDPYLIHVKTEDGRSAEYALMLLFEDSLNFIFQPVIAYGTSENVNLPSSSEHFWHFTGSVGDQILITAVPDSSTDVFLELYGPNADLISAAFISVGTEGVTEELEFTLPEDGLYSIRVGEWDFAAGSYELTLTEN